MEKILQRQDIGECTKATMYTRANLSPAKKQIGTAETVISPIDTSAKSEASVDPVEHWATGLYDAPIDGLFTFYAG